MIGRPEGDGPRRCPGCGGASEAGHVVERGAASRRSPVWVPAPASPEREGELRVSRLDPRPVTVYRCASCGRLEWVAE